MNVVLADDAVEIHRSKIAAVGKDKVVTVPLASLVAVNWKDATPMVNGMLQLAVVEQVKIPKADANDPRTIVFRRKQREGMQQLREHLEQWVSYNAEQGVAAQVASSVIEFGGVVLRDGQLTSPQGGGPVAGARAVVDTAGAIRRRITATRVVATGLIGLFWQKKIDERELYLLIEGAGWAVSVPVPPDEGAEARAFAAKVNAAASAAGPATPAPAPGLDLAGQLERLAALRDQGVLTDDEFVAAKAALL